MDWPPEIQHGELRCKRQSDRKKALHICRTASVELAIADNRREGIAGPFLAIDRHHIGVAGQHQTTILFGSDGGEQIRFRTIAVISEADRRSGGCQSLLRGGDQLEIGIPADGVKRDQPLGHRHELRVRGQVQPAMPSGLRIIARNSRRVRESSRNAPNIMEVTMVTPGLCTPRVVMH